MSVENHVWSEELGCLGDGRRLDFSSRLVLRQIVLSARIYDEPGTGAKAGLVDEKFLA